MYNLEYLTPVTQLYMSISIYYSHLLLYRPSYFVAFYEPANSCYTCKCYSVTLKFVDVHYTLKSLKS